MDPFKVIDIDEKFVILIQNEKITRFFIYLCKPYRYTLGSLDEDNAVDMSLIDKEGHYRYN